MDETTKPTNGSKSKAGGETYPSKQKIYSEIASHADEIFQVLYDCLKSKNEGIAMGAAKVLINKLVPDIKSVELSGQNGQPIQFFINAGGGFIPTNIRVNATSTPSDNGGSTPLQDTGVAQTSTQDNNGNNRSS